MIQLLIRHKRFLITAAFLLAAFLTYALNLRYKEHANPLERGVMTLTAPLAGSAATVNSLAGNLWSNYLDL